MALNHDNSHKKTYAEFELDSPIRPTVDPPITRAANSLKANLEF